MTKYQLSFSPTALRGLQKLPLKVVDAVLAFCEGPLIENPQRVGKPLGPPYDGEYSARRGSYRIVYYIVEDQVIVRVVRIEHRATVYQSR